MNKYRSRPHGSKSVRYTPEAPISDFDAEAFKVGDGGRALPKWPKDLAEGIDVNAWGDAAHAWIEP